MRASNEIYQLENPDSMKNNTLDPNWHLSYRDPKNVTLQYVKFGSFFDAKENSSQIQLNPNLQKTQLKNNKILVGQMNDRNNALGKKQRSANHSSMNVRGEYPIQNLNNHSRGMMNATPDIAYNQFLRSQYNPASATNISGGKPF